MIQKINKKFLVGSIFAIFICAAVFLLAGCGSYYESEEYKNLSAEQKIIEVVKREGKKENEYYVYTTVRESENSTFETTLAYDFVDGTLMLVIEMEDADNPGYKEIFATMASKETYNAFYGELKYNGIDIATGGGLYKRTKLLDLESLSITTFEGDESYRSIAGVFAALALKMAVLQIHIALEGFGIDFIATYFS